MEKYRYFTTVALPMLLLLGVEVAQARDLTFDERVKAQAAIERLYYSHQIGAAKSFEEAVPQRLIERKVVSYLREAEYLEEFWHSPIDAVAIRNELFRIAKQTRLPDRLEELYSALNRDPILIQECLASLPLWTDSRGNSLLLTRESTGARIVQPRACERRR